MNMVSNLSPTLWAVLFAWSERSEFLVKKTVCTPQQETNVLFFHANFCGYFVTRKPLIMAKDKGLARQIGHLI